MPNFQNSCKILIFLVCQRQNLIFINLIKLIRNGIKCFSKYNIFETSIDIPDFIYLFNVGIFALSTDAKKWKKH